MNRVDEGSLDDNSHSLPKSKLQQKHILEVNQLAPCPGRPLE
jgi:hypothetical protein